MRSLFGFLRAVAHAALVAAADHLAPEPEDDFWADWHAEVDALADAELAEMTRSDES